MAGAWLLAAGVAVHAVAAPPAANDPMLHGYVEPCQMQYVLDNLKVCQECSSARGNPERCAEELKQAGYTRKCRTSGHAASSEIWCRHKQQRPKGYPPYAVGAAAVAAASLVLGAFLLGRRRRREKK